MSKKYYLTPLTNQTGKIAAYAFYCFGCRGHHSIEVPRWQFNGDLEKPTFSPSLLITIPKDDSYRCHLFIRNGFIEYCGDSKHAYAGRTVQMKSKKYC